MVDPPLCTAYPGFKHLFPLSCPLLQRDGCEAFVPLSPNAICPSAGRAMLNTKWLGRGKKKSGGGGGKPMTLFGSKPNILI